VGAMEKDGKFRVKKFNDQNYYRAPNKQRDGQ
jgi:hypothetical protein